MRGALRTLRASLRVWHVKLILPSAGLFGFYLGAFLGTWLASVAGMRTLSAALVTFGFGAVVGVGVMMPLNAALGALAAHADLLKVPRFWATAAASLWLLELGAERAGFRIPELVWNLALWASGVAAIWLDEPAARTRPTPPALEAPTDPRSPRTS